MNNQPIPKPQGNLFGEPDPIVIENGEYKVKRMNILALDVATKTGWATRHAHGLWDFTTKKDESKGMKLIRFHAKLREMCTAEQISLIIFERTSGQHKAAIIHQAELHGVLKLFCEENNVEYKAYSASEIKSFATGKGNAGKPAMVSAAASKYGYNGGDDNVADALHIYHLAMKDLY